MDVFENGGISQIKLGVRVKCSKGEFKKVKFLLGCFLFFCAMKYVTACVTW